MADQDTITVAGQPLDVRGPVVGKPVSEFTSGIKIGPATYDDRQHAFYAVLDDFSGGFGHRILNVREALGTHWDNPGGVDVRRSRHITLPPKRYVVSPDADPSNLKLSSQILMLASFGVPTDDTADTDYFYYGAGDSIYRTDKDRQQLTRVKQMAPGSGRDPTQVTRFLLFRGSDNTRRLYVVTLNETIASRYWSSDDPGAASPTFDERGKTLWDAIVYDDKIVAQNAGLEIIYTANGVDWNTDVGLPEFENDGEAIWRPLSAVRFVGVTLAPWGTSSAAYFIDYGDGRLYVLDFYMRKAYPIDLGTHTYLMNGIMWGGQIAVTDGWNVWLYNPGGGGAEVVRRIGIFGKDGIPPSMRDGRYRITGLVDGGDMLYAIAEFSKDDKGTTLGFVVLGYNGTGWSLFHEPVEAAQSSTTLGVNPMSAVADRHPVGIIGAANLSEETTRALNVFCQTDPAAGSAPYPVHLHSLRLPSMGEIPVDGIDEFEGGTHYVITGWFDGGFADLEGALHQIKIDLQSGSSFTVVSVDYQLDDDEDAAWTSLGSASARGSTKIHFDATNQAGIQFRTVRFRIGLIRNTDALTDAMTAGQNTVPVADLSIYEDEGIVGITTSGTTEYITYTARSAASGAGNLTGATRGVRGSTAAAHSEDDPVDPINRTPEFRAVTVIFHKKAPLRQSWVAQIDVARMVERGALVDKDGDGTPETPATFGNIWDFLKNIWNQQTLVQLIIPQAELALDNRRVQVADMTVTQHDARQATTVHGNIDITFIEPVEPP